MKFFQIKLYNLITAPKVHTDLLWDLSILFTVLAVLYFLAIFYYRKKFKINSADTAKRKKQLAPMVSEFLFYQENEGTKEENSSYIEQKIAIRELLKDKRNESVLSEILLDLRKDVSGDTMMRLFKLYKDLNLEIKAFEKLRSFKWQKISQGMFELTQMQVKESYSFIKRFINDKRSVVRKQAEISTVTLMDEGISFFLDTTKYQISEWQQLKILEVLSAIKGFVPPRFNKWLTSKNNDVVLFSLRLIKHYDQNDTKESIISLVRHKNNKIKSEAIDCIKQFNFKSSGDILKAVFKKNNPNIKLAILDTLASFENMEDIRFLEDVYKKEFNFTVKSKALSAINTIYPGYVIPTEDLEEVPSSILEKIKSEIEEIGTLKSINVEVESVVELATETITATTNSVSEVLDAEVVEVSITENEDFEQESQNDIAKEEIAVKEKDYSISIFESLFSLSDEYCQLLLLDEILNLGDDRELPFLKSLNHHYNVEIRNKALAVKVAIESKLESNVESIESETILNNDSSENIKSVEKININTDTIISEIVVPEPKEKLLPLEYCFLLGELGIESSEPESIGIFDVNFEFGYSSEDDLKPDKDNTEKLEHPTKDEKGLTKEEHNFFQQLLHFPLTIKDDING